MRTLFFAALVLGCSSAEPQIHGSPLLEDSGATGGSVSSDGSGGASANGGRRATGGTRGDGGRAESGRASGGVSPGAGGSESDAGGMPYDAGNDARTDARADSSSRSDGAQLDSGQVVDADARKQDAATACECSSGPCCDGCRFREAGYRCERTLIGSRCGHSLEGCPYFSSYVLDDWRDVYCSGRAASCDGAVLTNASTERLCPRNSYCHGSTFPGGQTPVCGPCN